MVHREDNTCGQCRSFVQKNGAYGECLKRKYIIDRRTGKPTEFPLVPSRGRRACVKDFEMRYDLEKDAAEILKNGPLNLLEKQMESFFDDCWSAFKKAFDDVCNNVPEILSDSENVTWVETRGGRKVDIFYKEKRLASIEADFDLGIIKYSFCRYNEEGDDTGGK